VIQTGALYRLLKRMLQDGRIEEVDAPAGADTTDGRRRYYVLTAVGQRAVAEEAARMRAALRAARAARLLAGEDA
jgi:DNA-binding PadR family transcriptional regulator